MISFNSSVLGSPRSALKEAVKPDLDNSTSTSAAPEVSTTQLLYDLNNKFSRFGGRASQAEQADNAKPQNNLPKLDQNNDGTVSVLEAQNILSDPRARGTQLEKIAVQLLKQQAHMNKQVDGNLGINLNTPPPQGIFGFHAIG